MRELLREVWSLGYGVKFTIGVGLLTVCMCVLMALAHVASEVPMPKTHSNNPYLAELENAESNVACPGFLDAPIGFKHCRAREVLQERIAVVRTEAINACTEAAIKEWCGGDTNNCEDSSGGTDNAAKKRYNAAREQFTERCKSDN